MITKEQYEYIKKRAEQGLPVWTEEEVSNCCGAKIIWTDICSECKEHCDPVEEEDTMSDEDTQLEKWSKERL